VNSTAPCDYDVIVIGGALAGAATAVLLRRQDPAIRVLVVEKSAAFGRRVGEATVEVSAYFLGRVLGLTTYLNEAQLVKQGMRFWFFNEGTQTLADCSEMGGRYLARVPAYQVDRATLDEEVLRRAGALGAQLWRSASVGRIQLTAGGLQTVEVRRQEKSERIQSRWVVDASGVAALLARQEGLPKAVTQAAWNAQTRLHQRYQHLTGVGRKKSQVAAAALGRELSGFVWAIGRMVKPHAAKIAEAKPKAA